VWRDESAKFSTALWLAGVFPSLSARVFVLKESEKKRFSPGWNICFISLAAHPHIKIVVSKYPDLY
jgi:hypothetical protein